MSPIYNTTTREKCAAKGETSCKKGETMNRDGKLYLVTGSWSYITIRKSREGKSKQFWLSEGPIYFLWERLSFIY